MSGDIEGAGEDIATVQALSEFIGEQQTVAALLVSMSMDDAVLDLVQTVLPLAAKDMKVSDMLRERVEASPDSWNLRPLIRSNAYSSLWLTENLGKLSDIVEIATTDDEFRPLLLLSTKPGAVRSLKSAIIDIYGPAIRDYEPDSNERAICQSIIDRLAVATADSRLVELFYELIGTPFDILADVLDRFRANRLCTLSALDAVRFIRVTSTIPDGSAKGPYGYTDPFDGNDLRYRRDGEGFRVWSIGADRKDDGGTTRDEDNSNYDIVVVFPPILKPFEGAVIPSGPAPGSGSPP